MKKLALALTGALALSATTAVAQSAYERFGFAQIERGRYLAIVGDCTSCHTVPGQPEFSGGFAFETPVGQIVSSNITPDRVSGIGNMTPEQFDAALRRGIGGNGKPLYPAMPYTSYSNLSDEDVADLYAYFMSIEPQDKTVVSNQLYFPFDIRLGMVAWNVVNFKPDSFTEDTSKSAEWNRGGYLVEGLGHCGVCHSGKNLMLGDRKAQHLLGGDLEGSFAPNLTNDAHLGLGRWSEEEVVQYLKTGSNSYAVASAGMVDVILNSTRYMTDDDLKAIAVYLKSFPGEGAEPPAPIDATDPRMVVGQRIYTDRCQACHMSDGKGYAGTFPSLAGTSSANDTPTNMLHIILAGGRGVATTAAPTGPAMPSFGWGMTDDDIANVATFVRNSFGNSAPAVTASDVAKMREDLGG